MHTVNASPADDLQHILDTVPLPATIYLAEGIYRKKIKISRPNIAVKGQNRDKTVILWDDFAKKPHPDGQEYNTFRTYTVCVTGENVRLENITIENSNPDERTAGQCVALSVNAKNFSASGLRLLSRQDTLFLAPFPDDLVVRYSGLAGGGYYRGFIPEDELYMQGGSLHLFCDCEICGTVDFIFGCAEAYFYNCRVASLGSDRDCYVAAPAHSLKQERGFAFINCDFCGGAEGESVYLARPWRDFGRCDFIDCTCGSHIKPALFDRWNDTYRSATARFAYAGLKCANLSPVPWCRELPYEEAEDLKARCERLRRRHNL